MLIIKMQGGLGNQLFQYAIARSLVIKHNISFLFFDNTKYNSDYLERKFSLQLFNIKGTVLKNKVIIKVFRRGTKLNKILIYLNLFRSIEEHSLVLHDFDRLRGICTTISGYWQSDYYFQHIRDTLLEELVPLQLPAFPKWISEENTVAVGVRRKDFLDDARFGFVGLNYYLEAFALMKMKVKNPLFIIFSEDMTWCKENFSEEKIIFLEELNWAKDHLSLYLFSQCKHQIICNSSFYWWGAWLNTNLTKTVMRPLKPFNDASLMYESLFPSEWFVISN